MLQAANATSAIAITVGTNQPDTWSASRWIGARERWAAATICTMRASMVSRPTFSARMTKPPVALSVPAMTFAPTSFVTGMDSPVTIELVDRRAAFDQLAVDRNLLARPNPEPIADGDHVQGYLFVAPIRFQTPRRLRCEIEQGTDGARRLLTRPQLQHLTEQHEHGDDRRCLEIDRDCAVGAAKCRRKQAGRQNPDHAVEPRHAGTHGDQREHVQIAREERLPAAHEERPAAPEHDRRGEHELQPVRPYLADEHVKIDEVAAHLETTTGSASTSPIQNRRVMSASSGFGGASAVTSSGSSAMPQIGQAPGPTWRICGCIGQV